MLLFHSYEKRRCWLPVKNAQGASELCQIIAGSRCWVDTENQLLHWLQKFVYQLNGTYAPRSCRRTGLFLLISRLTAMQQRFAFPATTPKRCDERVGMKELEVCLVRTGRLDFSRRSSAVRAVVLSSSAKDFANRFTMGVTNARAFLRNLASSAIAAR